MKEKKEPIDNTKEKEVITKSMVITSSIIFLVVLNLFLIIAMNLLKSALVQNNFVLINTIASTMWVLFGKFEHLLIKIATTLTFFGIISAFIIIFHAIN